MCVHVTVYYVNVKVYYVCVCGILCVCVCVLLPILLVVKYGRYAKTHMLQKFELKPGMLHTKCEGDVQLCPSEEFPGMHIQQGGYIMVMTTSSTSSTMLAY